MTFFLIGKWLFVFLFRNASNCLVMSFGFILYENIFLLVVLIQFWSFLSHLYREFFCFLRNLTIFLFSIFLICLLEPRFLLVLNWIFWWFKFFYCYFLRLFIWRSLQSIPIICLLTVDMMNMLYFHVPFAEALLLN